MKGVVLIVEDDQDIMDVITILLRREGFSVLQACNGRKALEQISKAKEVRKALKDPPA